jgi:hypothetical protein
VGENWTREKPDHVNRERQKKRKKRRKEKKREEKKRILL